MFRIPRMIWKLSKMYKVSVGEYLPFTSQGVLQGCFFIDNAICVLTFIFWVGDKYEEILYDMGKFCVSLCAVPIRACGNQNSVNFQRFSQRFPFPVCSVSTRDGRPHKIRVKYLKSMIPSSCSSCHNFS